MNQEAKDTKPGEIPTSIPEIYFDIISRIVPGSIVIGVYGGDSFSNGLSTPTISLALVCSYLIGILLDTVGGSLWDCTVSKAQTFIAKRFGYLQSCSDEELWPWIRSLPAADRNSFTKMMAERNMLRSAAMVVVIFSIHPAPILQQLRVTALSFGFFGTRYCIVGWAAKILAFLVITYSKFVVDQWLKFDKEKYGGSKIEQIAGLARR